ncbi:MAG: glycosyltransferase family 4 protein [Bacteroidaceae bacterium]|nr:glycosyltransferase family 4 protein [Bacteroidaceae bacterium]
MKILFYTNSIYSFGGVQRVLAVVAKALAEEHDVTILTLDDPSREDKTMYGLNESSLTIAHMQYKASSRTEYCACKAVSALYKRVLPKTETTASWYARSSFAPASRRQLTNYINDGGFDVVVGVHVFLAMHIASIKDKISAKTIGWLHNSYEAMFEKEPPYVPRVLWHFCKTQLRRLDNVVVLCDSDVDQFRRKMQLKTTRIYNPLTVRAVGKADPTSRRFLSMGRMENGHKGFDILIRAFALFAQKDEDWQLDIVGEGPEQDALQALIDSNQLGDRVRLHPFTKDVGQYYRQSSVYVLASRWEGFGLVLTEAMSYGQSILASDLPVTRELLVGRPFASLFPMGDEAALADAMLRVAQRDDLEDMAEQAIDYASHFGTNAIVGEWKKRLE